MIFVFYLFAVLLILQGLASLRGGLEFRRFVLDELKREPQAYAPFASILIACRGVDPNLQANLRPLWRQDYPAYELVFVFDDDHDAARAIIDRLAAEHAGASSVARVTTIVAGGATDSGQKVHNLRAGTKACDAQSEVFAFLDTDARPFAGWLRTLIAPLADAETGATTGYRWFVPESNNPPALLRSVWNASITSALGANTHRNFCWGGSTAIRRATFERLGVRDRWRGTLSDDFTLTRVLHEANLPIRFSPRCLLPCDEDCTFAQLIEFTTRQIKITRVYAAPLWQIVLWSNLVFTLVFFGGIWLGVRELLTHGNALLLLLVALIYLLGIAKAALRLQAVRAALAPGWAGGFVFACAHLLLFPLTAVLYLHNALAALLSRRITWRGIRYELKSKTETVVVRGMRF